MKEKHTYEYKHTHSKIQQSNLLFAHTFLFQLSRLMTHTKRHSKNIPVNDKHDAIDSERGFGDVCRNDTLSHPVAGFLKNLWNECFDFKHENTRNTLPLR